MTSQPQNNALVVGATGGIGGAFVEQLSRRPGAGITYAWARHPENIAVKGQGIVPAAVDITDEESIAAAAEQLEPVDLAIVATGILHTDAGIGPEKSTRDLEAGHLAEAFAVNAIGPALLAKHIVPKLRRDSPVVFAVLSARVGSIADNRIGGWYGYRASKAALNQIIRTLAVEVAWSHPKAVCAALHPGTVDTGLSAPFQDKVPAAQLFSPDRAACQLLEVIDGLSRKDSGALIAWDGTPIPY